MEAYLGSFSLSLCLGALLSLFYKKKASAIKKNHQQFDNKNYDATIYVYEYIYKTGQIKTMRASVCVRVCD